MPPVRKPRKDRTSFIIAAVLHALLIGGVVFWAYKTGKLEQMRQAVLQYVRSDKKEQKEPAKPIQQKAGPPPKLPPINQGMPPASTSGTRRAVAADAPAAAGGESFFQDTRAQGEKSVPSAGAVRKEEPKKVVLPPAAPKPMEKPKPLLRSQGSSTVKALLQERAKAAAAVESFGAEQISRSSVSDAGDIVARVSGATVVEGKYAVIRGLTDRYSAATLNGAELPSADPYRRSAALDMFPAKIIDRVTVTKTFTPDQPGSFTGGNINIVTKSFPDRPFVSLELGTALNTQTTGNDRFLTYTGGGKDWLGMDDGTRALPAEFWDPDLSFGQAYSSLTARNPLTDRQKDILKQSFELDRLTKLAGPAEFAPKREAPPPAHSFVASAGDTFYFLGRPMGLFLSLPYARSYSYYEGGQVERSFYQNDSDELEVRKEFTEEKGTVEVNWAATASVAYQIFPDQQLGYNFIFNQYSEDSARIRKGKDNYNNLYDLTMNRLYFIERNLTSHQLRGDHLFAPLGGLKMDWLATFTDTYQDEPDTRFYHVNGTDWGLSGLDPKLPTRYWRYLEEKNDSLRVDFTLPFLLSAAQEAQFKFGWFSSSAERDYRERILQYDVPYRPYPTDPNQILLPGSLGLVGPVASNALSATRTRYTFPWTNYIQSPSDRSFYHGESEIPAQYAMLDVPVLPQLRLIGGARFEQTEIRTTSFTTVPSEGVKPGETNSPSPLVQDDILPALGLVWTLTPKWNLRLNYGETITRPSFRELAGIRTYDPVLDEYVVGNPELEMTAIKNYDARLEWFPRPGELFSVGVFYKDLANVIEKEFISSAGDIITFVNRPEAKVYGIEFEARKSLEFLSYQLRHWSLGGNLTLMESEQPVSELQKQNHTKPDLLGETRPMADQSPYIVNAELAYDNPAWGTSLSLSYNVFGPRLIIANLAAPDIYEQPVEQLDLVLAQRLGRNLRLKIGARNLLDPRIERTYGKDRQAIYSSYTRGRTYSLSLNYEF